MKRCRLILSAYACEPGRGSEPGVGWYVAQAIAGKVELTVVTRANNQKDIENSDEEWINQVRWIYHDLPSWAMWWKKGGRGVQLYYILWQLSLFFKLWFSSEFTKHDVVHHITFGKYWVPSFLSFGGLPTVFGPVGGGEDTPEVFRDEQGKRGKWEERGRKWLRLFMTWNPVSYLALRMNCVNIAATPQTETRMSKLGLADLRVLPQSAISVQQLKRLNVIAGQYNGQLGHDQFVLTCVSRLISWKAIHLAIEAFVRILPDLPEGSYLNIVGQGPEKKILSKMVAAKNLEGHVRFIDRLPELSDVFKLMAESDCVLHPALHEAFGQACLESIAVGTPVICWDWAGPGMIVGQDAGIAVMPMSSVDLSVQKYCEAILRVASLTPSERDKLSVSCRDKSGSFTWERLANCFMEIYNEL